MSGAGDQRLRDRVVELLFAAAYEPERWSEFARAFSDAIGGHSVIVFLRPANRKNLLETFTCRPFVRTGHGFRMDWVARYPWSDPPLSEGPGRETLRRFVDFEMHFPGTIGPDDDYHRKWLEPQGLSARAPVAHNFAHDGDTATGTIVVCNRIGLPPVGPEQLAFADGLCDHFRTAHRVLDELRRLRREQDVFREVIDRLPSGVLLVDEGGRVMAMNESARLALEAGQGLTLEGGRLTIDDDDMNRWLQETIDRACDPATRAQVDPSVSVEARRASWDQQTPMMVTPLRTQPSRTTLPDTAAMIFLANPQLARVTTLSLLRTLYELTQAEAELAWLLADGDSLDEAAEKRGVTLNTARSQLKRVFAKTGVNRQADLVRLVLGSVGSMQAPKAR